MRDRRLEIGGAAAIVLAGAALWVLYHPGAPIVARAAEWPLVGGAVRAVRARYLPPPPKPDARPSPRTEVVAADDRLPEASSIGSPAPERPVREPAAAGASASRRRAAAFDAVEPVGPLPPRAADADRLSLARRRLGPAATRHSLGGYELWTDHSAPEGLVARWRPLVAASERAWGARYGVAPLGTPAETIVLFARHADFADFAAFADELGVGGAGTNGVTGWGIVAVAAEEREPAELDGVLQHELAHLLTRRSIGPALPSWLAEGLAEDFGEAPLAADGRLDFARVRGAVLREANLFEIRGGLAALDRAGRRAAAGEGMDLARLVATPESELAAGEAGPDRYADAFVWIRFLLAEPERAAGFRDFLAAVRAGGEPSLAELDRRLPQPHAALARELAPWIVELRRCELAAHGAPTGLPDASGVVYGETATLLPDG